MMPPAASVPSACQTLGLTFRLIERGPGVPADLAGQGTLPLGQ
jgi:hypothetical protein